MSDASKTIKRVLTLACNLAALAFCVAGSTAGAVPLVSYDFTSNSLAATTVTDVTATDFLDGPGITGSFSIAGQPAPSRAVGYPALISTSEAEAIANEEYFEFELTPDAGFRVDLNSLTLQVSGGNVAGNQANFSVRSSLDGFLSSIGTSAPPVPSTTFHPFVVDLSEALFQSVAGPISFRTYLFDNGSEFGSEAARIDNVVLDGTVAPVPVPAAIWLLASAIVSFAFQRQKVR